MLAIYETIENHLSIPKNLEEFEDLLRKELQRPILLTQPSLDEQVIQVEQIKFTIEFSLIMLFRNFYQRVLIVRQF